jgi:hypothetical protein
LQDGGEKVKKSDSEKEKSEAKKDDSSDKVKRNEFRENMHRKGKPHYS